MLDNLIWRVNNYVLIFKLPQWKVVLYHEQIVPSDKPE